MDIILLAFEKVQYRPLERSEGVFVRLVVCLAKLYLWVEAGLRSGAMR